MIYLPYDAAKVMSVTMGVRRDRDIVTAADVDHRAGVDKLDIVVEVFGRCCAVDGQRYLDTSTHYITLRSRFHIPAWPTELRARQDISNTVTKSLCNVGNINKVQGQ